MSVIYIAGPMTGRKHWNVEAFEKAEAELSVEGHVVLSPIHHDRRNGYDHRVETEFPKEQLRDAALHAAQCIVGCDRIFLLDGWPESKGAIAEAAFGLWLGKYVYDQAGDIEDQKELMKEVSKYNSWFREWGFYSI